MNLRLTDSSGITAAIDYANDHPEVRYLVARAASAHGIEIPDTWTDPVLAAFKGKWTDKAREKTDEPKKPLRGPRARGKRGVTAAVRKVGYKWNASLHPRGRNGRFIKKGSLVDLFDIKSDSARPVLRAEAVGVERDKSGQEMLTLEVSKPGSYQGKDYKAGDTIKVSPKNVELAAESKGRLQSGDVEGTPSGTNRQSAPEAPDAPEAAAPDAAAKGDRLPVPDTENTWDASITKNGELVTDPDELQQAAKALGLTGLDDTDPEAPMVALNGEQLLKLQQGDMLSESSGEYDLEVDRGEVEPDTIQRMQDAEGTAYKGVKPSAYEEGFEDPTEWGDAPGEKPDAPEVKGIENITSDLRMAVADYDDLDTPEDSAFAEDLDDLDAALAAGNDVEVNRLLRDIGTELYDLIKENEQGDEDEYDDDLAADLGMALTRVNAVIRDRESGAGAPAAPKSDGVDRTRKPDAPSAPISHTVDADLFRSMETDLDQLAQSMFYSQEQGSDALYLKLNSLIGRPDPKTADDLESYLSEAEGIIEKYENSPKLDLDTSPSDQRTIARLRASISRSRGEAEPAARKPDEIDTELDEIDTELNGKKPTPPEPAELDLGKSGKYIATDLREALREFDPDIDDEEEGLFFGDLSDLEDAAEFGDGPKYERALGDIGVDIYDMLKDPEDYNLDEADVAKLSAILRAVNNEVAANKQRNEDFKNAGPRPPAPVTAVDRQFATKLNRARIFLDSGDPDLFSREERNAMAAVAKEIEGIKEPPLNAPEADVEDYFLEVEAALDKALELESVRKNSNLRTQVESLLEDVNKTLEAYSPKRVTKPGNEQRDLDEARVIAEGEIAQFNDKANPAATRVIHARSLANTAKALAAEGHTEEEIIDLNGGTEADWTKKADALERMAGKGGAATSGTRPFPMRGPTGRPVVGKKADGLLDQAREVLREQGVEVDSMSDLEIAQAVPEGGLKTKLGTVYRPGTTVPISDADRDRITTRLGVLDGVDTNAARTERSRLRRQLRESGLGADGNPITPDDREAEKEDLRGRVGVSRATEGVYGVNSEFSSSIDDIAYSLRGEGLDYAFDELNRIGIPAPGAPEREFEDYFLAVESTLNDALGNQEVEANPELKRKIELALEEANAILQEYTPTASPDAPLEQFYSVKGELEVVNNQIKALGDSDPSALDELIARRALIQEKMRVAARGANIASGAIRTLPDGSTLQRRPAENDGIIRVHDPAKSVRADPTDAQLGRVDVGGFVEDLQRDGGSASSALIIEPDGTARFTPERQAIHDRIIASFLDGVLKPDRAPGEKPTMYVLGGGPASGKSTGMTAAGVPEGEKRTTVHVDPDAIKYALLAEGVNWDTETPEGVGYVHEESSYLAKRLNQAGLERGLDVTLDGTGDGNPNSQRKKVLQAKATRNQEVPDGYRVVGSYMTVPVEGENGAIARDQKRSRTVGEYRVRITHSKVSAVFPDIEDSFDEVTVWDTNVPRNESPILVYQREPGSEGIVLEPDLYQQFLDKANTPMPSNLVIPPGEPGYIAPGQPGYPAVTP